MNVMLYRKGKPGVMATLPGKEPLATEMSDLLGGELILLPMTNRLTMAVLADAYDLRLPLNYAAMVMDEDRHGATSMEPVPGDAVIFATVGGCHEAHMVDITDEDAAEIISKRLIRPQGGK